MPKGSRGGSKGGGANNIVTNGTDFVSFSPTAGNKNGERVVTMTANDEYQYSRQIPSFDSKIDTSSQDYRRALSDYNVKAKFNENGTVSVSSGGLFSRKQTFNSIDSFHKEANSRIDKQKKYWDEQESRIKSGKLTQIEAENIKTTVRNNSKSMAIKKINDGFKERIMEARTYSQAGTDMKQRLSNAVDKAKKKQRQK